MSTSTAPVRAGLRPGSMIVRLGGDTALPTCVVWYGAARYLDKAGEIVTKAVRMTEEEAVVAAAPQEEPA